MKAPELHIGQITDVLPALNAYNVSVPHVALPIQCMALGASNPGGAREFKMYPAGTTVLCFSQVRDGGTPIGVVLGALPAPVSADNNSKVICDSIAPTTPVTPFTDDIGNHSVELSPESHADFNIGLPIDAIPGHDAGVMQDLGGGYGAGYMEAWIRASDIAGLWCYYQDNLVRLAAYNFDFWNAGGARWIRNDQGENNDVDEFTPFPWEALGLWRPDVDPFSAQDREDGYDTTDVFGKAPCQTHIPRHRTMRGYVGDLFRRDVILPLPDPSKEEGIADDEIPERVHTTRNVDNTEFTGLLSIQEHLDGRYSVRSAKGICHEKYLFVPTPMQTAEPEASAEHGDTAYVNYAPSGLGALDGQANEDSHVRLDVSDPEDATRPDMWIAQLFDIHAYMYNFFSVRHLTAHDKDWSLPDEGYFAHYEDADDASEWFSGVYKPEKPLRDTYTFPLPALFDVGVDFNTSSRYYCSRSIIEQMDDGSIVIEDGYGSSIQMSGGNIHLTCAGDFFVRTGRSAITWAGDDAVIKAGSSIDVTAAIGDVRLKAERNLHMLAGNGSLGGMLFDCRSEPIFRDKDFLLDRQGEDEITAGIMFKTKEGAPLLLKGSDVRIIAEGGLNTQGVITMEATGGIITESAFMSRKLTRSDMGFVEYGPSDQVLQALTPTRYINEVSTAIVFSASQIAFANNIYVNGTVYAADGVVPATNVSEVVDQIESQAAAWVENVVGNVSILEYFDAVKDRSDWMEPAEFTYRTPKQYGTDLASFYIAESRWQRAYRNKQIGVGFVEPPVTSEAVDGPTYPYPGNADEERYRLVESNLFDWDKGYARPRSDGVYGDGFNAPAISELREVILGSNYLVSKQEVSDNVN